MIAHVVAAILVAGGIQAEQSGDGEAVWVLDEIDLVVEDTGFAWTSFVPWDGLDGAVAPSGDGHPIDSGALDVHFREGTYVGNSINFYADVEYSETLAPSGVIAFRPVCWDDATGTAMLRGSSELYDWGTKDGYAGSFSVFASVIVDGECEVGQVRGVMTLAGISRQANIERDDFIDEGWEGGVNEVTVGASRPYNSYRVAVEAAPTYGTNGTLTVRVWQSIDPDWTAVDKCPTTTVSLTEYGVTSGSASQTIGWSGVFGTNCATTNVATMTTTTALTGGLRDVRITTTGVTAPIWYPTGHPSGRDETIATRFSSVVTWEALEDVVYHNYEQTELAFGAAGACTSVEECVGRCVGSGFLGLNTINPSCWLIPRTDIPSFLSRLSEDWNESGIMTDFNTIVTLLGQVPAALQGTGTCGVLWETDDVAGMEGVAIDTCAIAAPFGGLEFVVLLLFGIPCVLITVRILMWAVGFTLPPGYRFTIDRED